MTTPAKALSNAGQHHCAGQESKRNVIFLESGQFVMDMARPVPRASLGRWVRMALWILRVCVFLVTAMVIYTFSLQLR